MRNSVVEFIIRCEERDFEKNGVIYKKLGLDVYITEEGVHIKSTQVAHIKSLGKEVHIHVYSTEILNTIISEGFVKDSEKHDMPLKLTDDFENILLVSFLPKDKIHNIAIVTSGGDAPGMNPAIRAAIRTGLKWDANVYGIYSGYEGLITDNIKLLKFDDANGIIDLGGTILYSARSKAFRERQGRKTAVYNLARRKIEGILVLGGDGSIEGGTILRNEFETLVEELISEGKLPVETPKNLNLVAIPASIDNDIPMCDVSLGADSALHRVIEAVDHVITTMISHHRIFVMEVMGRDCGYIALMSAFATGADFVFLPEAPNDNWRVDIVSSINNARSKGKKGIFVIVSEGAIDSKKQRINSQEVVDHLINTTQSDVRLLKLGHLQRGGPPSAFDRINSTLMATKAIEYLLSGPYKEPVMVALNDGEHKFIPLEAVFGGKRRIVEYQKEGLFDKVLEERDSYLKRAYDLFEQLRTKKKQPKFSKKIGILHCGGRAGGMNCTLHAIVRYAASVNQKVCVFQDGFDGLISEQYTEPNEYDFVSSIASGGSAIGTGSPNEYDPMSVYKAIKNIKLDSLILIGGSAALLMVESVSKIIKSKNDKIDLILIPATTSNNIPYTELSLGCDTALNCIVKASEVLRLSSMSMKRTVFIMEVHGGYCGFLGLMGGIAAGAFDSFIPERKYIIGHLSDTAKRLRYKYKDGIRNALLLIRNEKTFLSVSTDAFALLLKGDSENSFETKYCVLGYLQQGANPSPLDRLTSTVLGIKTMELLLKTDSENICDDTNLVGVIGTKGRSILFTGIEKVIDRFDRVNRRDKNPFWLQYASMCRALE